MDCVRITAVDFNGKEFDGSPFKFDSDETPQWLKLAILDKQITIASSRSTDYAEFEIITAYGNVVAGPGDIISQRDNGTLEVYFHSTNLVSAVDTNLKKSTIKYLRGIND
jgi:hypothetical protein